MFEKRCKSAHVAKATGINPSVLSRYLSGANKPSSSNIIAISHYLNISPEWLLSSSDAPESIQKSQVISSATEPLLEQIKLQKKMIQLLEKRVDELEEAKAESKVRHTKRREQLQNPTKPNKRRVGFLKKHKPKK